MHWPDPAQRARIVKIRDNLIARIAEAEHEGWLGEVEGLKVSLAGAEDKLTQIDRRSRTGSTIDLGLPTVTSATSSPRPSRAADQPVPPQPRTSLVAGRGPLNA